MNQQTQINEIILSLDFSLCKNPLLHGEKVHEPTE